MLWICLKIGTRRVSENPIVYHVTFLGRLYPMFRHTQLDIVGYIPMIHTPMFPVVAIPRPGGHLIALGIGGLSDFQFLAFGGASGWYPWVVWEKMTGNLLVLLVVLKCFKCVLAPRKGDSWRHKNMNRSGVECLGVFSQNIFGLVANEIKESLPPMAHGLHRTSVCWARHIHLFFGHNPKDCYPISPRISHSFTYTLTSL